MAYVGDYLEGTQNTGLGLKTKARWAMMMGHFGGPGMSSDSEPHTFIENPRAHACRSCLAFNDKLYWSIIDVCNKCWAPLGVICRPSTGDMGLVLGCMMPLHHIGI